jgi:hypothetical protein
MASSSDTVVVAHVVSKVVTYSTRWTGVFVAVFAAAVVGGKYSLNWTLKGVS